MPGVTAAKVLVRPCTREDHLTAEAMVRCKGTMWPTSPAAIALKCDVCGHVVVKW